MVRRNGGSSQPVVSDPSDSIARVSSITASLKQKLQHEPRVSFSPEKETAPTKVLILLEAEPSASERTFLEKMMSAIQVMPHDFVVEWGAFPEHKAPVVVGLGLGVKQSERLLALRRDRFELPSLQSIQSDPQKKRMAWETLKKIAERLRELT